MALNNLESGSTTRKNQILNRINTYLKNSEIVEELNNNPFIKRIHLFIPRYSFEDIVIQEPIIDNLYKIKLRTVQWSEINEDYLDNLLPVINEINSYTDLEILWAMFVFNIELRGFELLPSNSLIKKKKYWATVINPFTKDKYYIVEAKLQPVSF